MRCANCISFLCCSSYLLLPWFLARGCYYIWCSFSLYAFYHFLWYKVLRINYGSCASLSVLMFFYLLNMFNILRAVVSLSFSLHYSAVFVLNISTTFFISFCFRYFPFLLFYFQDKLPFFPLFLFL